MTAPHPGFCIGEATITRIEDLTLTGFATAALFPELDPAAQPGPEVPLSVHSWLLREPHRTVLIDTGAGNGKQRPHTPYFDRLDTPYLERLRAAGVAPEDVDLVLLTHLHVDHVGWNTRREGERWVPTFPNARYVFSRAEHACFAAPASRSGRNRTSFLVQQDSIDPVIEAGLADMIEIDGTTPVPGFTFHPTPGHSPAHASIAYVCGTQTALFAGDVLHHPLQVARPGLNSVFDADAERSRRSRAWALGFAADRDAVLFGSHLGGTGAGRVQRVGAGFMWHPG